MSVRIGINGFGRTGRALLRAAARPELGLEVAAVNDLAPPEGLARLLSRDSVYGRYGLAVRLAGDEMVVGEHKVQLLGVPKSKYGEYGELTFTTLGSSTVRANSWARTPG